MILYAMRCEAGHGFETWFRSSDDCEDQTAKALVECPQCGSAKVAKAIMAPAVKSEAKTDAAPDAIGAGVPHDTLRRIMSEIRNRSLKARDVGWSFASEVRDMAEGRKAHEHIRGKATPEDVADLHADGIPLAPIPSLESLN